MNPESAPLRIEIDGDSGFCFGVVTAIRKAEEELETGETLYCLGDIVHNNHEVERLRQKGLITVDRAQFHELRDANVLLRAHGEPPVTYARAKENHITLIDATCPVVLQLQKKIKQAYLRRTPETQIVIYGKAGHAEVNGLVGQTNGAAIVVENTDDLHRIDFSKPIELYAQTTKSVSGFRKIVERIDACKEPGVPFHHYDTICRQVANRIPNIRKFAGQHELILFVSGRKSSNGRILYDECVAVNPNSRFVSSASEIDPEWIDGIGSAGICGATSTPKWLMEEVAVRLQRLAAQKK